MEAPGLTSLREVESLTGWLLWSLQLDDELLRAKDRPETAQRSGDRVYRGLRCIHQVNQKAATPARLL